jgi:fatty-acyl-CoA synthase
VQGLMQDVPLTVDLLLRRASEVGRHVEVVTAHPGGAVERSTWGQVADRALRLGTALDRLGISPGGRVGTFAHNGQRHLELYLAAPCSGRVLHTANIRLHADDIAYVIDHAGDEVLFVDASLTAALAPVRDRVDVGLFVVMEDGGEIDPAFADSPRYEELLAAADEPIELGRVAEGDAASMCFTSGTTGRPKAVVYSHRSVVLHSFAQLGVDGHAVSQADVVLPITPMFHVNAWGLPYTCALAPAKLVLPGRDTSPEAVAALIESERVTSAAGVPTIWLRMLDQLDAGRDLSSLRRVMCGGAEASERLVAGYTSRGITFFHGWGATEMSPTGTGSVIPPGAEPGSMRRWGLPAPGVEVRLIGDDGEPVPWDGVGVGELEVRGPWITAGYYRPEDAANETRFSPDGWWRTGDVARISPDGTVEIADRVKDLIKSGGEWISSLELERAILDHPEVSEVAVVAIAHPEWGERPAALVVPTAGASPSTDEIREFLADRVARWWLPDLVEVVDDLPKTGVGKYDKRRIRADYADRLQRAAEGA